MKRPGIKVSGLANVYDIKQKKNILKNIIGTLDTKHDEAYLKDWGYNPKKFMVVWVEEGKEDKRYVVNKNTIHVLGYVN